jgi:hypothetical protein
MQKPARMNKKEEDSMLRLIVAIVLIALHPFASAQSVRPPQYVNLNAPGAMELIRTANPAHYEKIQGIVDGLAQQADGAAGQWIRTSFGAKQVSYSGFLLTSYPPQKDIAFTLDSTRYYGRVTLSRDRAEFFQTKSR